MRRTAIPSSELSSVPSSVDVVVVGLGGSGAPFAARVSEDSSLSVLGLEAGPVPRTRGDFPLATLDPGLLPTVIGPGPHTWWHRTEVVPDRPYDVGRGQGAGGSTSVNGAYFVRPRRSDLQRWADAGNPSWDPALVEDELCALERDLQFGAADRHGGSGPMPVDRSAFDRSSLARAFAAAADAGGHPQLSDLNDIDLYDGHGALPLNVENGARINTALAYLLPALHRPGLTVVGGAEVQRVVMEGRRATGVEAVIDGRLHRISAGEVVLAAGPVRSPQLLQLSGIGPVRELERVGVTPVVDSPGVGASVSEHPDMMLSAPLRQPYRPGVENPLFAWAMNWTASGSASPGDLEFLPLLKPFSVLSGAPNGSELAMIVALQRPHSRGRLTLVSADPRTPPIVQYHHLHELEDRRRMREGLRTADALLRSEALRGWIDVTRLPRICDDDADLDRWMLQQVGTAVHLCGSAPMGPDDRPGTVTSEDGRVHGTDGLRVIDTSVLPDVPSRGPALTAVLLGERMAARLRR